MPARASKAFRARSCLLARDYESVGTKGSLTQEWGIDELAGNLASIGNHQGDAIAISNALGRVQVRARRHRIRSKPF